MPSRNAEALLQQVPQEADDASKPVVFNARIKKGSDIVNEYQTLERDDYMASRDRAAVQSMVDGNPPHSEERLRALGLHGVTNVNFGLLNQAQTEAEQPFIDIIDSMDNFGIVPIKPGIVPDSDIDQQQQVIAEELYDMITGWEDFHFNWWLNAHFFTMFGASFTYREDGLDWRWRTASLQEFKIPRGTRASINSVDRLCLKGKMQPSELFAKIRDEKAGKLAGWNPEAIKKACKTAAPVPLNTADPEDIQAMWKDNAVYSGNTNVVVQVIHMWVKEVDGTISHYITDYRAVDSDEFLYEKRSKYGCMYEFCNAYLYGVGTNGDLHSIRGNAWNLFSSAAAINKLLCKFLDKANDEANTFLSTESEDATIDNMIVPRGPYFQLTTGVNFVERKTPPVMDSLVPAIQNMQDIFRLRSGGMAPRATALAERGQKTKYELQRRDELEGKLSSSVMGLFFTAWAKDYCEIVRRVSNPDLQENHPGGKEVFEFRRRCIDRGVSETALLNLDHKRIKMNMGIGRGSSAARRAALGEIDERYYGRLDPEGQRLLNRMGISSLTDARLAKLLVPDAAGSRPPMDQQVANIENQLMQLGGQAVLEPNQNHVVHVETHLAYLQQLNDQLAQALVELQDVIPQMQQASEHAGQHMQFIDPESGEFPLFKEALQQLNEVIVNGAKHIEAEERKAAKAAQRGEAAPEQDGTPLGVFGQAKDAAARLEVMLQKSSTEMQIAQAKARQEMTINDAMAAQKIKHIELERQARKNSNGSKRSAA